MLVFPSSMGRFFEWEDQGMITALGEQQAQLDAWRKANPLDVVRLIRQVRDSERGF